MYRFVATSAHTVLDFAIVLLFLLALAPCVLAQGTIRPVADGAELLAAIPNLQPGDTVLLTGQDYFISTLYLNGVNGTANDWITFRAASGRARIVATAYQDVIRMDNCNYLRFEDLEITTQLTAAGINGVVFYNNTSSSNITFDGCWIHDCTSNGIKSQAVVLDRLTVVNTEINNCHLCGIYVGFPNPLLIASNTVIRNCYIHDCSNPSSGYGIQVKGGSYGSIIENNVLHDIGAPTRAAIAIYWADTQGNQPAEKWSIVRDNVIWNSPNEGIFVTNSAIIENNILFDIPRGIVASPYAGYAIDNLVIRHNTLYRCSTYGIYLSGFNNAQSSVFVANNAVFSTDSAAWAYRAPSGTGNATVTNNGYYGQHYGISSGMIALGTPSDELKDASGSAGSLDFYPKTNSLMRNAGSQAFASQWDFNGTRRDLSAPVTLGAYERIGSSNPGWTVDTEAKPVNRGLTPAVQEVSTATGGVASLELKAAAPAGTLYMMLMSAVGPAPQGSILPLIPDAFTSLPYTTGTDALFTNYLGLTGSTGANTAFVIPALQLPVTLTVYHSAVLFDTATLDILESTPPVRVLMTP